ncbi:MAG: hypothetical protein KF703_09885 [Actinobacteria bacterium]|nr:hypothetical protein [Actinomycetota bacterium]
MAGGVVALVLVAGAAVLVLSQDRARPVTVEEARDRLGTDATDGGDDGLGRPAEGVYRYEGTGTERLSVPPLSQDQGPTMPGTVEHLDDGCWSFRLDYSTNHWQAWDFCLDADGVHERGGSTWQRWMLGTTALTNLASFTCPTSLVVPAEREDGQRWTARCDGTNEMVDGTAVSTGTYEFVGEETLAVGDDRVAVLHFRSEREMSGAQEGTDRADWWFAPDTGMLVRNRRRIEVRTDTPVGASTYREEGEFRLVALEPAG